MQLTRVFLQPNSVFPKSPSLDFYFKPNTVKHGYWAYITASTDSNKYSIDYMKNNHNVFANYVNKNNVLVPIKGK